MIYSGLLIFFFLFYHLAHFTFFGIHPEFKILTDLAGRHDVYSMVILGFQNKIVSFFYMLTMLLLAIHISHGFASMFQSVGIATPAMTPKLKAAAYVVAFFLFLGFSSVPIAVLLGYITLPTVTLG
jgi:succinate dehydrogenase / fumarate reductase cytochrome b subunit